MCEIKRIFSKRAWVFILLAVFLNSVLFVFEQESEDYGYSRYVSGIYRTTYDGISAETFLDAYKNLLEEYKSLEISEAAAQLEGEYSALLRFDDLLYAIQLRDELDVPFSDEQKEIYDFCAREYPDVLSDIEAGGDYDASQVRIDYVVKNQLLDYFRYLTDYDDYLESVQSRAEKMVGFSYFSAEDSFSRRNIEKTAADFEKLDGVSLSPVNGLGIEAFFGYRASDYFLLAVLIYVCLSILSERRKGLWSIIHATPNGRARLAFSRIAALFISSVIAAALLYGSVLVISLGVYGGFGDLSGTLQSVEIFKKLPLVTTVGGLLVRFFLIRALTGFMLSLIIWALLSSVRNVKYILVVLAAFFAVEYTLYATLPVQSAVNVLKYFNVFTYINLSELYMEYLNIDLFGYPVGIRSLSVGASVPLCIAFSTLCVYQQCSKKPFEGRDVLARFTYALSRRLDMLRERLGLVGMELYKLLVLQRGIVVLVLLVCAVLNLSFAAEVSRSREDVYFCMLEGPVTGQTLERLRNMQNEVEAQFAAVSETEAQYQAGEIDYETYFSIKSSLSGVESQYSALMNVGLRLSELRSQSEELGIELWILEDTPYRSVYGTEADRLQIISGMVAALCLALMLAGCFAYDTQSGMPLLANTTVRGRRALLGKKYAAAAILCVLVWGITYGRELYVLLTSFELTSLGAPVQSLDALRSFPVRLSIGGFLALIYALGLFTLYSFSIIILAISRRMKRAESAVLVSCCVAVLPAGLYFFFDVKPLRYISFPAYLSCSELFGTGAHHLLVCFVSVLAAITVGAMIFAFSIIKSKK